MVTILERGMKDGELKKTDPLMAVVVLLGMIIHSFTFMPIAPYVQRKKINIPTSKLGEFVAEIYFTGLSKKAISRKK